MSQVLNFHKIY